MSDTNAASRSKRTGGAKATINWIVNGKAYETAREPGMCPKCGAIDTVTELPPPLRDAQTDGTTHVCHPSLGGCNHGFARRAEKKASKQRGATKAQLAHRAKLFGAASPSIHDDIAAIAGALKAVG